MSKENKKIDIDTDKLVDKGLGEAEEKTKEILGEIQEQKQRARGLKDLEKLEKERIEGEEKAIEEFGKKTGVKKQTS